MLLTPGPVLLALDPKLGLPLDRCRDRTDRELGSTGECPPEMSRDLHRAGLVFVASAVLLLQQCMPCYWSERQNVTCGRILRLLHRSCHFTLQEMHKASAATAAAVSTFLLRQGLQGIPRMQTAVRC